MANPWDKDRVVSKAGLPSAGLAPSSGFHRVSPTEQAPDANGPQSLPYIGAVENLKAGIQTGAEKQVIGARTAADVAAERAKAQIKLDAEARAREAERQFKLSQTPQQRAMADLSNDEVLQAVDQARSLVNKGNATGAQSQLFGRIGGTSARDLKGTLTTIMGNLTLKNLQDMRANSPTGASGMGSLTEKEGELLASTVASLDQAQSSTKLLDSLAKIETHYRRWNALNNGDDPNKPEVAKHYGLVTAPPPKTGGAQGPGSGPFDGPSLGQAAPSQGATTQEDPTLSGVNAHVRKLISSGAGADQVNAYLEQVRPGLSSKVQNIGAWVKFHQQRPNAPIDVNVETKEVPMSNGQKMLNLAAQSKPGAYFIGAADAISGGTADNMAANPAQARAAMSWAGGAHPVATGAGQISGAMLDNFLLAGAGNAVGLGRAALPLADGAYGAAYGAGSSDDGNRVTGALTGAALGAGGGQVGRMAFRGMGNAVRGVRNPDVQALRAAGVDNMTLGQMVGQSGRAGAIIKGMEDRSAGFSGIGDAINNQRNNSLRGFNRAAFNEGLAPVSPPQAARPIGELGVENALDQTTAGYHTALDGVNVQPDAQFANDYGAAMARGSGITRTGPEFQTYAQNRFDPIINQPSISGRQVQDMLQGVQRADFGTDSMGQLASDATHDVGGAITDMVNRQAPDAIPALGNANRAYRNTNILADAVGKAMNSEGVFSPAQLGQSARTNATRFNGKIASATTDRPFFDLQRAGQNVLPSKIADSGTAGREQSIFKPGDWARMASQAAIRPLYSDSVNPLLNTLLLDRPNVAVNIGDYINSTLARPAGMFGNAFAMKKAYATQ